MKLERRWQLFWLLFVSYVFCVYFRKLFSLLLPSIVRDVTLTKDEMGFIVSTQYAAYAVGKLFFGIASDLASPTVIVVVGLVGIILSMHVMAVSTTLWHFLISATINGFLQGSGWPAIVRITRQMFSVAEFGRTYTILACTNNVAGFIGPLSLVLPWRQTTFLTALYYSFTMASRAIAETWIPIFVSERLSELDALRASFFFETGGLFGSIISGVFCDFLCAYFSIDHSRLLSGIFCTISMFVAVIAVFWLEWVFFSGFMFGFFVYASINIWGIVSSDLADDSIAGRCGAFVNFISSSFAAFAGAPLAWLIDCYGYSVLPMLSVSCIIVSLAVYRLQQNRSLHICDTKTA
ncbi:Glucose-6-phosphate translocase [Toxocara canis]|uniref:Glucose-6-phosphate translocase n=1 Tax=Toxocara canis TaxID=6265 RepID=A0A0B2UXB0_TOXCA|nr:Glucose-6-phosphate translocase [Toxocara canis]